jgi:hypothetical protein
MIECRHAAHGMSRTIDLMWRSAVADRSEAAAALGEASHGVHLAIIALSPPGDYQQHAVASTTVVL